MLEILIDFKTAKFLKQKGFNEISDACYDINGKLYHDMNHKNDLGKNVFSAPRQSLLQKWLIDNYNIFPNVELNDKGEWVSTITLIKENQKDSWDTNQDGYLFKSFDDAMGYSLYESLFFII